jgi:hypothetical protein
MAVLTIFYVKFMLREERAKEGDDSIDGQHDRDAGTSEDERTPLLGSSV